ncbi:MULTISPECIES: helix-turn-helix transcriptional regulator [unclassified Bradyrhizobium]|uniref:helix-turn-helix domain-containing protein n=1 Tax=unclassified Bradyrhizobium TaxID=2631580 RepID=UPI0028E1BC09|nr:MULTISPECIES: helix-turn-helix transcriptional regulator [unclassified Bradyrhizobium]
MIVRLLLERQSRRMPLPGSAEASNQGKRLRRSSKKPNHVDQHVGTRLRLRRNLLDLSQDDLAGRLGVTAQLIQKYEAGETRISASCAVRNRKPARCSDHVVL